MVLLSSLKSKSFRIYFDKIKIMKAGTNNKFIDSLIIKFVGGSGGNGLRRYGGIGGRGGCIYLEADDKLRSLKSLLKKYSSNVIIGNNGKHSVNTSIYGQNGTDLHVKVPIGISLIDNATGVKFAELNEHNAKALVAFGGDGGGPTNNYIGQMGQFREVTIDLKLIADVGFVGFPNAGKSTLLKALSRTSPKIGSYPFTTLTPNIGTLVYNDHRHITAADLPGLIEGASKNIGLGHSFLKHVMRTQLILLVVDVEGFQYTPLTPYRSAIETLMILIKEIELYDDTILTKPMILTITKSDKKNFAVKYEQFLVDLKAVIEKTNNNIDPSIMPKSIIHFDDLIPISSHSSYNIKFLRERIRSCMEYHYQYQHSQELPKTFLSIIEKQKEILKSNQISLI